MKSRESESLDKIRNLNIETRKNLGLTTDLSTIKKDLQKNKKEDRQKAESKPPRQELSARDHPKKQ